MKNNIDLNKLPDDYLISYYQDLMFNLAKSSKDLQDIFLQAYYNLQDATQNRIINKFNLYAILGFSAIKIFGGFNEINDISPYLLSLIIASYNFVAEKYNRAKIISNKNFFQKFILNNIADEYLEIAAMCEDDSVMERVLNCMDKAFYNILLSEKHMIRIQNYKYMRKYKKTTNSPYLNEKELSDSLISLSRCILEEKSIQAENLLYKKALLGDITSIILFYLASPSCNTEKIDNIVNNFPLKDLHLSYQMFMACFLSDRLSLEELQVIKQKSEFDNKKSLFLEQNGKPSDFSLMCECFYYKNLEEANPLTLEEKWAYKRAKRCLRRCKTEISFFYQSFEKCLLSGKKHENGIAALQNFAARGFSHEIIEPEKLKIENIYVK